MAYLASSSTSVDPAVTAGFLGCLGNVLTAEAWFEDGKMIARVRVTHDANIRECDLKEACLTNIGIHQTPRSIILERAAKPAA
ncbi:MAG TPA: hypothetical protein VNI20_00265 [Fimbriimonadaceae bacterium]|nr:hypothetical protein [Fimbriimonadaceae bacterium]